ncbi:glycosyltransferase family 2 protein [Acinetobacter lanii]|uniref:glycosyltransferase family 2 protein n=1 Tax=Acinetobacter lanii TaxID=2715163 RepID=UPI002231F8FB|nr:glycosyltransferase family 2 protein [Acinetobacter lanii]
MAGLSSRFFKAGYDVPKYQLTLPNQQTVFEWAISSFEEYYQTEKFIFILRDVFNTPQFVEQQIQQMGILNYEIVILDRETCGQAETVALGLKHLSAQDQCQEAYIFNIDSKRHHFIKPQIAKSCDGYLEVFRGEGDHWSFIQIDDQDRVTRTTEKDRISDLCSDGLYFFKHISVFLQLVEDALREKDFVKGELYIAPLYNRMIKRGDDIGYDLIEQQQISFCGTPDEYLQISSQMSEQKI